MKYVEVQQMIKRAVEARDIPQHVAPFGMPITDRIYDNIENPKGIFNWLVRSASPGGQLIHAAHTKGFGLNRGIKAIGNGVGQVIYPEANGGKSWSQIRKQFGNKVKEAAPAVKGVLTYPWNTARDLWQNFNK